MVKDTPFKRVVPVTFRVLYYCNLWFNPSLHVSTGYIRPFSTETVWLSFRGK